MLRSTTRHISRVGESNTSDDASAGRCLCLASPGTGRQAWKPWSMDSVWVVSSYTAEWLVAPRKPDPEADDMSREGDAVCMCLDLRADGDDGCAAPAGCVSSETVREGAVLKSNELLVLFMGIGFESPTK